MSVVILLMDVAGGAAEVVPAAVDELALLRAIVCTPLDKGHAATPEDLINCAECYLHDGAVHMALPVLLHVHDTVNTADLAAVRMDGCDGRFLLWAGLSRASALLAQRGAGQLAPLAKELARRARTMPLSNARRIGLMLAYIGTIPASWPGEYAEECATALEVYPANEHPMPAAAQTLARWHVFCGRLREALQVYDDMLARDPRADSHCYLLAGELAAWLGDYRQAFTHWCDGLTLPPVQDYAVYNQLLARIYDGLPYATQDELVELPRVTRSMAARYPAQAGAALKMQPWLALSNHAHIVLEMQIRTLEQHGNPAVSNLWQQALEWYRHPEYARKLAQYDREAQLWCERLRDERRLVHALAIMRRINLSAAHVSAETSNQFAAVLDVRWKRIGRYRRAARTEPAIAGMVYEFAHMRQQWNTAIPERTRK